MWKLVIADDEPKVRAGLRGLVEGFGLELDVCGEAKNGVEALRLIQEREADLALVDICMPKLNGLQLIERIRQLRPFCRIIIVSAFNEFAYAKEAVALGVRGYILKPIVERELYEALRSVTGELSREREQRRFIELLHCQIEQNRVLLRGVFFNDWIEGRLSEEERRGQQKLLSVRFGPEPAIVLVSIQNNQSLNLRINSGRVSDDVYGLTMQQLLEELLEPYTPAYVFMDRYQNAVGVFNRAGGQLPALRRHIEEGLEEILNGKCTVVVGACREDALPESYAGLRREVQRELECRPVVAEAKRYLYEHFRDPELDLNLVARYVGINPSYMSRLMKQELGISFKDFLTSLRINESIILMRSTDLSISEIAYQVGYKSLHYFSTAFKNTMGISPSEHRKNTGPGRGSL